MYVSIRCIKKFFSKLTCSLRIYSNFNVYVFIDAKKIRPEMVM